MCSLNTKNQVHTYSQVKKDKGEVDPTPLKTSYKQESKGKVDPTPVKTNYKQGHRVSTHSSEGWNYYSWRIWKHPKLQ